MGKHTYRAELIHSTTLLLRGCQVPGMGGGSNYGFRSHDEGRAECKVTAPWYQPTGVMSTTDVQGGSVTMPWSEWERLQDRLDVCWVGTRAWKSESGRCAPQLLGTDGIPVFHSCLVQGLNMDATQLQSLLNQELLKGKVRPTGLLAPPSPPLLSQPHPQHFHPSRNSRGHVLFGRVPEHRGSDGCILCSPPSPPLAALRACSLGH